MFYIDLVNHLYIFSVIQKNVIDDCALGTSGCNQVCTNTTGIYACSCYLGYHISSDNKTCNGKYVGWQYAMYSCITSKMQIQMNALWV